MRKSTATVVVLLTVVLAFALGCSGSAPYNGDDTDTDEPDVTYAEMDLAKATIQGVGEVDDHCVIYEATVFISDYSVFDAEDCTCPEQEQYVHVQLERLCCEDILNNVIWTGMELLWDHEYELHMPDGMNELWSATVTTTVTVTNNSDPTQTRELELDLTWTGLNDFRFRTEHQFAGEMDPHSEDRVLDARLRTYYEDEWSPAKMSGSIDTDDIIFLMERQDRVSIRSRYIETYTYEDEQEAE